MLLVITLSSIIAVPLVWYVGYRMLKHFGYEIVEIVEKEQEEEIQ